MSGTKFWSSFTALELSSDLAESLGFCADADLGLEGAELDKEALLSLLFFSDYLLSADMSFCESGIFF